MSEFTKAPEFIHVERLLEAPVIYFDAVPTAGFRGPLLSVTLALIVGEAVSKTNTENHMLAVGNLRMTTAAAEQLRDVLGNALLAAHSLYRDRQTDCKFRRRQHELHSFATFRTPAPRSRQHQTVDGSRVRLTSEKQTRRREPARPHRSSSGRTNLQGVISRVSVVDPLSFVRDLLCPKFDVGKSCHERGPQKLKMSDGHSQLVQSPLPICDLGVEQILAMIVLRIPG